MSFEFPANVERDIRRYAQAEHTSPEAAAVKLVQDALKSKRRKSARSSIDDTEWQKLKEADPAFAFFERLPDSVIEDIHAASKQTRDERFTPPA